MILGRDYVENVPGFGRMPARWRGMGDEAQPIIVTPGAILNAMETVDRYIDNLNVEIVKQLGGTSPTWYTSFRKFRSDWKAYFEANKGLASRLTGARWSEVQGWRQRAEAFRKNIEEQDAPAAQQQAGQPKKKIRVGIPKATITGEEPPKPWYARLPWLKIGIGVGALVVAWPLLAGARRGASALGTRLAPRTNFRRRS